MRTPRQLIILASVLLALVVLVVVASRGGSTSGDPGTTSAGSRPAADESPAATDAAGRPVTTALGSTTTTTSAVPVSSTSLVASPGAGSSSTTRPQVVPPTAPATTDPFAPTPPTELPSEPGELPGPPVDDCVDAAANQPVVELSFDLDGASYAGVAAPSCLRVYSSQRLSIRNDSPRATTVSVGAQVESVAPGAALTTAAMGSEFQLGDIVDLYIESLDLTVLVQVLG